MSGKLDCALDLLRRLPPQNIEENVSNLVNLAPSIYEALLSSVDQPLKIAVDNENNNYLLCDYNRDGDSYRSPWTNHYLPPLPIGPDGEGGLIPSTKLRDLEVQMNTAFDQYRKFYYGKGISSCYLWDTENSQHSFAGIVLIKKYEGAENTISGGWDSIHVVEVNELKTKGQDGKYYPYTTYKITSTCMLWLESSKEKSGTMNLGGSITRQVKTEVPFGNLDNQSHLTTIGELVEEKENQMRNALHEIYFGKIKDGVNCLRSVEPLVKTKEAEKTANDMLTSMQQKFSPMHQKSECQVNKNLHN